MYWSQGFSGVLLAASFFSAALASPTPFPDASVGKILPVKRAFSKADALDPKKVLNWMAEVKVDATHLVFDRRLSTIDSKNFVDKNKGYRSYIDIFNDEFSAAFGGAKPSNIEVENACNMAMGMYADGDVRFFGVDGQHPLTRTLAREFGLTRNPKLKNTYFMKPGAIDPNDHFDKHGPWPQDEPIADPTSPDPNAPTHMLQMMWNEFALSGNMNEAPARDGPYWQFYEGSANSREGESACNVTPMGNPKAFKVDPKLGKTPKKDTVNGQWKIRVQSQSAMFQGIGRKGKSGEIGYLHFYDHKEKESRSAVKCFPDPVGTQDCDPAGKWTPVARCVW